MIRNGKRIRAVLLAAALVFTQLGATAYAAEPPADAGLCEHHPEHTAKCGYTAQLVLPDPSKDAQKPLYPIPPYL